MVNAREDVLDEALNRVHQALKAGTPSVMVLLPHSLAVTPFAKQLTQLMGPRAPVRATTLAFWAEEQPLQGRVVPQLERLSLVVEALKARKWFELQDRWALARETLSLVDELTHWGFTLPANPKDFADRLAEAYAARQSEPLQFEARFVHDLWWVLNQDPLELSPAMAYQQRLAALAAGPKPGLCLVVAPNPLTPAEQRCLTALGAHDVRGQTPPGVSPPWGSDPWGGLTPKAATLQAAWQGPEYGTLAVRAQMIKEYHPQSPLQQQVILKGFGSLEEEALQGANQIQTWLDEQRGTVALVAQDRVVARRVRAMLERRGIAVRDESGWTFSTTAASTVVMRWLNMVSQDGHYRLLQDLLHSTHLCADWSAEKRARACATLERLVRRTNWVSGFKELVRVTQQARDVDTQGVAAALELAQRFHDEAARFPRQRQRFVEWMTHLKDSLSGFGMLQSLQQDAAGVQLLEILEQLTMDAQHAAGRLSFSEWMHALDHQFEEATFMESEDDGAVRITQLSMTRLRSFDAVLMVGADREHLPFLKTSSFFGDSVRASLGLPTRQDQLALMHRDLAELLTRTPMACITWRNENAGERNPLAAPLQRLDVFHQLAWGSSLIATPLADVPLQHPTSPATMPAPALPATRVPETMSASGYGRLMACPYQFFADAVLGLGHEDAVSETVDKRDYGQWVHAILHRFHSKNESILALGRTAAIEQLLQHSRRVFEGQDSPDEEWRAWRLRWETRVPAVIDWMLRWEEQGWRYTEGETKRDVLLGQHTPGQVKLKGTLDRVDRRINPESGEPELAILDYKLKNARTIRRADIDAGEDVQLPVYTLLTQETVNYAAYLTLDGDAPDQVRCDHPNELALKVGERLVDVMKALREGVVLPAHGDEDTCRLCHFGGLCRRDHWQGA